MRKLLVSKLISIADARQRAIAGKTGENQCRQLSKQTIDMELDNDRLVYFASIQNVNRDPDYNMISTLSSNYVPNIDNIISSGEGKAYYSSVYEY